MDITQARFALSMTIGLLTFGLIAKWYLLPWIDRVPRPDVLTPLLLLHSFRYIGLAFVTPEVVSSDLASAFATPAAYGDLATALFALLTLGAVRLRGNAALPLVWIFNIMGTLDLGYAVFQGTRHAIASHLGAAYFIPILAVPVLLVTHYLIFRILLRPEPRLATSPLA